MCIQQHPIQSPPISMRWGGYKGRPSSTMASPLGPHDRSSWKGDPVTEHCIPLPSINTTSYLPDTIRSSPQSHWHSLANGLTHIRPRPPPLSAFHIVVLQTGNIKQDSPRHVDRVHGISHLLFKSRAVVGCHHRQRLRTQEELAQTLDRRRTQEAQE